MPLNLVTHNRSAGAPGESGERSGLGRRGGRAGVPGKLHIATRRERDGCRAIEIADDGVGLPEGFDPESGKSTASA